MRKLLLFIALIISGLGLNAQKQSTITIEIGADKNLNLNNTYALPTADWQPYSISQQFYAEDDFDGNLGTIKSIAFKLANATSSVVTRKYEIYMKHTTRKDAIGFLDAFAAEDMVFDGEVEIPNTKDAWLTIPFNKKNFDYSGGYMTVLVYDKTGAGLPSYHMFYEYETTDKMSLTISGTNSYDRDSWSEIKMVVRHNCLNLVRFEMESKAIVKAEPAALDLGETMLGEYWSESKPASLSIKAVATTVTDIKADNEFFVLPAKEEIDFTADPIVIEVSYNKNAEVDGEVKGNIVISYEDTTLLVPVTANAYTPGEADVWELAKEIKFENNTYKDTPAFDKLHDNYLLPRETANAVTLDAVYSFELKKESIICAKVEGVNAKMAIYKESFNGKGGPSNDNNYKGNVFIDSEFFFDFNEEVLNGWTVKNAYNNANNWQMQKGAGVDGTNCIVSYSYRTYPDLFFEADNFIMTERTYNITENSKLSFYAMCDPTNLGDIDHVKVKVSKDGESMTLIEEITPTSATYSNNVINLGAKFAELGLEYGDYHIVLHHQETQKFYVCVDNIRLSNSANVMNVARSVATIDTDEIYGAEYPVGKYYVVAAAEGQFNIELTLLNEEDLPATPANLVATTIDEFSIKLEWDAVEKATSYNIYRNDEFVANVVGTTFLDENLESDVDYCYVVKAYNDILESVASEKACAKTKKVVLTPPTEIKAVATSTTTIVLTWSKVEKVGGYAIYSGYDYIDRVSDTTYTIENLVPNTEYCYMVSSVYKDRESFETSDVACTKTFDLPITTPTNLVAEATSTSSISLTWNAVENALSYNIYNGVNKVANVATTSYVVDNLNYYTDYCFTVSAVRNETETDNSEPSCAKTFDLPITTPANLVAEATSTSSISLTWNAVENALSYNVYQGEEIIANVTTNSYEVDNLNYYTDYCFTVTAVRNETETEKSEPSCAKTFDLPITTPANLVAEATSTSSISLTWNAVENALSYNIYNGVNKVANVTTTSYVVDNLNYYTDYCFTVSAVRNEMETSKSESACAKTFDLPITPPTNLVAEATSTSSISLTWNAVVNALSYNIYNGVNKVANVTTNSYEINNLNYYTDYCFTVTAVRNETETEKSEPSCAKTFDLSITIPTHLVAEATSTSSISLAWNAVENALSYNVYQGEEIIANVTTNSYEVDNLNYYTDYCFTVTAVRNETETEKSEPSCAKTFDLPITTPTNLVAEATSTSSISLTWNAVENALSYNIYNGVNKIANVTTNSYEVNNLNYYTDYCFTVTAVRNETETENSEPSCAKTFDLPITIPNNLVAEATGTSSISLTWNAVENALSYNIYNGVNKVANVTTTSYVVDNLNYYTDYCFTVSAVRNETETDKSEEACSKTFDLSITTPENLIAEALSFSSISLTWNAVENALSYNVYNGGIMIANVTGNSYIVNDLNYDTDYCYTVTAVRNETETDKSEEACAKTLLPITTPENVIAEATGVSSISLTWNAVENALSYNVYSGENKIANVIENTYIVNELNYYTDYCFTVTAVRNETETEKSESACAKTFDLPIATPENVNAEATSISSISLTWDVVENALSYNVYCGENLIANVTENSYVVNNLNYYTDYCYTVTALRNETESDKSEEVCAKTFDLPITKPEEVVATPTSTSSIIITWEIVENALSYNLYRDNELVKNLKNTNYTDTGLEYDTEYCYVVAAVRNETESEKSEKVCVKTLGEGVNEMSSMVNVYPIPVTDKLFIGTETYIEEISIYTLSGVMIYKEVDFNNKSVDVSEYNSGVYVIKIKSNDKVVMKRFIKN